MTLWIGTSGWQYAHWRGRMYPRGLPTSGWFDRYAEMFDTVELNVTFYRQPKPAVFESWARRAPDGFRFAVKASRFLTHVRRLRDPRDSVERLLDGARRLGPHLGPILVQLPPDLEAAPGRLDETLAAFPPGIRVAVEFRHRSWFVTPEVRTMLRRHGAALCWADRRGPRTPVDADWATASWGYVRFHAGNVMPPGCYGERSLTGWLDRVRTAWPDDSDVFLYWNNDHRGCAPRDAGTFAALARRAGVVVTRAPDPGAMPVG